MPGDLVRHDWYGGELPAVVAMDDGSFQRYQLVCRYESAYAADDASGFVWLEWYESDPGETALCSAKTIEKRGSTKYWRGYHPVAVEVSHDFAERWGGQALADTLEAAAATRTSRCPDAPDGPAPYEEGASADPTTVTAQTTIDVVLSGGPGEEPPVTGTTIELSEDDQHQLVIGGPGGKVIREGFLGDRATIGAYGPLVTDADGNWSVLVTVDVTTAPTPTPLPSPKPSSTPEPTPTPGASSPDPTTVPATPSPSPEPATESPASVPTEAPGPLASPTPIPLPSSSGCPPASPPSWPICHPRVPARCAMSVTGRRARGGTRDGASAAR